MVTDDPSAFGIYDDLEKAERTIDELRRAGFQADEIGIIGHVGPEQKVTTVPTPKDTHEPEQNAVDGFVRGAVIGAIVGAFVALVIPGLAAIAGEGRWFEIVGGAILGAVAWGVIAAFSSFVFMRPKTRVFASELEKGRIIVTVSNAARKEEAVSLLRRQGIQAG